MAGPGVVSGIYTVGVKLWVVVYTPGWVYVIDDISMALLASTRYPQAGKGPSPSVGILITSRRRDVCPP